MQHLRFALFGNVYQAKKSAIIQHLLHLLEERGADVWIDRPFHSYLTREMGLRIQPAGLIDGNDFEADFVISLGGDGTFLQAASRVADKGFPILGINTGRLGFLADVSPDEMEAAVEHICNGGYRMEARSLLQVTFSDGEHPIYPYALNEVAVLKRDHSSMISIRADINGEYLTTYQADGLIINTPTGSTGYALSVGGPIMSPRASTLGIVPVAPHSLNVRPMTLFDDAEVRLTVESRSHNYLISIDGRNETCCEEVGLTLRKAPFCVNVLKRPDHSFFRTLRSKLMWGTDARLDKGWTPS